MKLVKDQYNQSVYEMASQRGPLCVTKSVFFSFLCHDSQEELISIDKRGGREQSIEE